MPQDASDAGAASLSPRTVRLYATDWATFRRWCQATGQPARPAPAAALDAYVAELAKTRRRGTIDRRLAAIAHAHRGHACPLDCPALRARLRTLKRQAQGRPRTPPPSPHRLTHLADRCPGDVAGRRDRAVLSLAALGLDRAALVGLDAEDVRPTQAGTELAVGRDGHLRVLPLPRAAAQALADWLRASDTAFGPLFRKVNRWGQVEPHRLGTDAIRRIVLRRARSARL